VAFGSPVKLGVDPRDVFIFAGDGRTIRLPERQVAAD
jgi:hypothetical protein